jgi:serine/threonine-protein kinase
VADPRDRFKQVDEGLLETTPFAGSPLYMSPEQAKGDVEIDCRSDIYSLGAVGYFLVTGRPPFEGKSPWKVMLAHARNAVTPPAQLRSDLPAGLEAVLLKCLAKQPQDRYQDIGELAAALDDCRQAEVWTYRDAETWWATHVTTCEL